MSPTPRLVALSIYFYRLMLAAYPIAFRQEYGEAMAQLFRDTARDAYRRRGFLGLSVVWLRTLADFTISVIRQHRDKPAELSSESVLLHDFLHKWRRLGSEALSVTVFSAWYSIHLLRLFFQRAILVWATLTAIAFGIWFTSSFHSTTLMRVRAYRVDIDKGLVQILHWYDGGEPIPLEQWRRDTREWVKRHPTVPDRFLEVDRPWDFSFFSDIPIGSVVRHSRGREPELILPYKYWRLRFPFVILPALLLLWTIRVYLRRKTGSVAAMHSA